METTSATVLFAHLHGYDTLVERLRPIQVASMLSELYALLTCAVLECGGQILHLAPADMMAGFGVGDSRHAHIHEALMSARMIQQRFAPMRASWHTHHSIDAGIGIGVHRGEAAIGVFGPPEHPVLTLVGDTANFAAQLSRRSRSGEVLMSAAVHLPYHTMSSGVGPPPLHLPQLRLPGRGAPMDVWCAPVARR